MSADDTRHILVQAPVRALDPDGLVVFSLGTAAFAVAAVVLGFQRDALRASGDEWWFWTAVAGLAIGLGGSAYCWSRRVRRPTPVE